MRLKITHETTYSYDQPVHYALLQLRLTPRNGPGQQVVSWDSTLTGGKQEVSYEDPFGNVVQMVQMDPGAQTLRITSQGEVEVENLNGVIGKTRTRMPLWLYRQATPATRPGPELRRIANAVRAQVQDDPLNGVHALSAAVAEAVTYQIGTSQVTTTAEEAAAAGQGVCQDQAQVMIACARLLGLPARYVSGYLLMQGQDQQEAGHGWAEIWIDGLGWVGFDAANAICPDERYVRVALGRDYAEAAPVHGLRQGSAQEELYVSLQVQQ